MGDEKGHTHCSNASNKATWEANVENIFIYCYTGQ